jgi:dolichol kinase
VSDLAQLGMWMAILATGLGACIALHALGVATTYVRDLLHVGAGVWIVGWPHWHSAQLPVILTLIAVLAVIAVPLIAPHLGLAARLRDAVSDHDELWDGLVVYVASYGALTTLGLTFAAFPAAAGLLALSLGDGIGGAVGRRFGTRRFRTPCGKRKSLEGAAAVAVAAGIGVLLAAHLFDHPVSAARVMSLGLLAAVVEALSPRSTDNLLVPAAVWAGASL